MIMSTLADSGPPGPVQPDTTSVETTRLSLTALQVRDLNDLMHLFGDEQTARMTHAIPHPLTQAAAEQLLSDMMAKANVHWAIRKDERLIGVVSLTGTACGRSDGIHSFGPNLSIFVGPEHRGRGYAIEAIDGLLDWVKRKRLHSVVHAAHFADNEASARLLATADFLYTGRRTWETSLARAGTHLALHTIRIL